MSKSYKIRNYDYVLLFMTIGIAVFGVFMIYSAAYYTAVLTGSQWRYVTQQVLGLGIGVVGMILVSGIDYRLFIKPIFGKKINFVYLVYLAAIIMQVAVLFVGVEKNGAKRWLNLGFVQFQPSEISKIAAILFVAYAIYRSRQSLDHFAGFAFYGTEYCADLSGKYEFCDHCFRYRCRDVLCRKPQETVFRSMSCAVDLRRSLLHLFGRGISCRAH